MGIISFPISKVLDYLLGSEHGVSTFLPCGLTSVHDAYMPVAAYILVTCLLKYYVLA